MELSLKEQKTNAKSNLIEKLEKLKKKILNLYVNEQKNGKPLLYPLPQEIMMLYNTIEKTIKKLTDEIEQERAQ